MEEVQKSGGTESFGLDRTPTYDETRNPAWEAYHRARIQKALAPELHEAQHKLWAHFFDEHALQEGCPAAAAAWLSRLRALLRGAPRRPLINTCTKNFCRNCCVTCCPPSDGQVLVECRVLFAHRSV